MKEALPTFIYRYGCFCTIERIPSSSIQMFMSGKGYNIWNDGCNIADTQGCGQK